MQLFCTRSVTNAWIYADNAKNDIFIIKMKFTYRFLVTDFSFLFKGLKCRRHQNASLRWAWKVWVWKMWNCRTLQWSRSRRGATTLLAMRVWTLSPVTLVTGDGGQPPMISISGYKWTSTNGLNSPGGFGMHLELMQTFVEIVCYSPWQQKIALAIAI